MGGTHQSGSLKVTLVACCCGTFMGNWHTIAGLFAFQWTRYWSPEAEKPRLARWRALSFVLLFWAAGLYGFCEHGSVSVDTPDGPKAFMLRDAIGNVWRGFSFEDLENGFKSSFEGGGWNSFVKSFDIEGEKRALRTLGMAKIVGNKRAYTSED